MEHKNSHNRPAPVQNTTVVVSDVQKNKFNVLRLAFEVSTYQANRANKGPATIESILDVADQFNEWLNSDAVNDFDDLYEEETSDCDHE